MSPQDLSPSANARPRVRLLGATCDLAGEAADGQSVSFSVSEFAELDDGFRVILHTDRGFTLGWGGQPDMEPISRTLTRDELSQEVLNTVLPDEDDGEAHPWEWLAQLVRLKGWEADAAELRRLPYQVNFTRAVEQLVDHL